MYLTDKLKIDLLITGTILLILDEKYDHILANGFLYTHRTIRARLFEFNDVVR